MAGITEIARQFITFCGVGSINTAFSLAVIFGLTIAGVNYMVANFIGYVLGLGLGFVLHKKLSFRDELAFSKSFGQFRTFILIFAVAYAVQFICLYVLVDVWGVNKLVSQLLAVGVYTILNYIGNRVLTFGSGKEEAT